MSFIQTSSRTSLTKLISRKPIGTVPSSRVLLLVRHSSTDAATKTTSSSTATSPWFLSSAVCIERVPLLTPELSDLQKRMLVMLREVETEQSRKCGHEIRHEEDLRRAALKKTGEISAKEGPITTAADDEDAWRKELGSFQFGPRKTKFDETNDVHSHDRCLDRPLYLVVERKVGSKYHWDLPTSIWKQGETLRQTAERAVKEHCGDKFDIRVLGNAPWAVYKYKYPKKIQEKVGKTGEKVFLYKAFYSSGPLTVADSNARDFRWLVREDTLQILDEKTRKSLHNILYDEEP